MTSPCRPGCDELKGMDAALCSKCIALLPPELLATLRNAKPGREKKEASSKARAWLAERTGTAVMGVALTMLSDLDHDWPTTMAIGDRDAVPMPGQGSAEKKEPA